MNLRSLMASALVLLAGGCASLQHAPGPSPEERLEQGLAALERGDYRAAHEPLSWVYTHYADEPIGRQALLALVAAELDPRNPSRRLGVGADLAARYLRLPGAEPWTVPLVETVYLLAMELGAAEERVAVAEESEEAAREEARAAREQAREARAEARSAEARAARAEAARAQEAERAEAARAEAARAEAARAEAARTGAQPAAPQDLPQLPGPPVTARVAELERELAACRRELDRIRRAATPR